MKLNVLAIGAHPDDLEILAGGTILKYFDLGNSINIAVITDGAAGHGIKSPEMLREIRYKEAEKTAKLLNSKFFWLGLRDEFIFPDEKIRLKIIDIIRQVDPDIIITHSPNDYHPDHVNLSKTVFDASFVSTLPNIVTDYGNTSKVVPLFYLDTLAGINFNPDYYVDITDQFERKKKILGHHISQIEWLKNHDDINIFDFIEITAKFRGLQCGVRFAEGFKQAKVWPRLKTNRLLP